jgi:serine/threonine-protein kinase
MKLLDSLRSLLSTRVDLTTRYELMREAISGTMSSFYKARDRQTGQIVGLKIIDIEKTRQIEGRFKGLNKPTEGEIGGALNHACS